MTIRTTVKIDISFDDLSEKIKTKIKNLRKNGVKVEIVWPENENHCKSAELPSISISSNDPQPSPNWIPLPNQIPQWPQTPSDKDHWHKPPEVYCQQLDMKCSPSKNQASVIS